MANRTKERGFLSYNETGSRLTKQTANGLLSKDLGRISIGEAERTAWLYAVPLIFKGRIRQHAA